MHDLRIQLAVSHGAIDVAVGSLPDSQIYDIVKMELALDWSSGLHFYPSFQTSKYSYYNMLAHLPFARLTDNERL